MHITTCRSCQSQDIHPILSLGQTPLANSLLKADQLAAPENRFPLEIVFCAACSLVQTNFTVPPEQMFSHYVYLSSFSTTMLKHSETLVNRLVTERGLTDQHLVVEVASNDGYLLQYYKQKGVKVLGIEPAENIAAIAREQKGIPTISEFFGLACAERLRSAGVAADVIHGNNVLAHVPAINGFVSGLQTILRPDGVIVIEAPYIKDLIDHVEFDTIYHEHFFYYSLTALVNLFARHGLSIIHVERIPIHGGSLRLFATHTANAHVGSSVRDLLKEEQSWGVDQFAFYESFSQRVETFKHDLRALLTQLKSDGRRIAVYGASAKGSTLMNYCQTGRDLLTYAVDRSHVKQGLYTPGTHLLIKPTEALLEDMPDYVLLLAWNFADEILEQQAEYRSQGGRFIVPLPIIRVV